MDMYSIFAAEGPNGNWIPSDIKEFYWGAAAFLIVVALMAWKLSPVIKNMMTGYSDKIASQLSAAETAQAEAQAEVDALKAKLGDAGTEAARIRSEGDAQAERVKADLMAKADADAASLRERADSDLAAAGSHAAADLQAEAGLMAMGAAEAVVQNNLDDATQNDLIENYINQVGQS